LNFPGAAYDLKAIAYLFIVVIYWPGLGINIGAIPAAMVGMLLAPALSIEPTTLCVLATPFLGSGGASGLNGSWNTGL
jgi:hypothetical protein